jgi:hypothetical protein
MYGTSTSTVELVVEMIKTTTAVRVRTQRTNYYYASVVQRAEFFHQPFAVIKPHKFLTIADSSLISLS